MLSVLEKLVSLETGKLAPFIDLDMKKYIEAEKLIAEINRFRATEYGDNTFGDDVANGALDYVLEEIIPSLQQEQPEDDLERIENDAELIANKIMIGVQANRYHTCVYNTGRNDFNHSHLVQAARKGIELGLNARKK